MTAQEAIERVRLLAEMFGRPFDLEAVAVLEEREPHVVDARRMAPLGSRHTWVSLSYMEGLDTPWSVDWHDSDAVLRCTSGSTAAEALDAALEAAA